MSSGGELAAVAQPAATFVSSLVCEAGRAVRVADRAVEAADRAKRVVDLQTQVVDLQVQVVDLQVQVVDQKLLDAIPEWDGVISPNGEAIPFLICQDFFFVEAVREVEVADLQLCGANLKVKVVVRQRHEANPEMEVVVRELDEAVRKMEVVDPYNGEAIPFPVCQ